VKFRFMNVHSWPIGAVPKGGLSGCSRPKADIHEMSAKMLEMADCCLYQTNEISLNKLPTTISIKKELN